VILIDIEVYTNVEKQYETFEAIVDAGATFCVMAEHIAQKMGYLQQEKIRLWQVNSPLTLAISSKNQIQAKGTPHRNSHRRHP